MTQIRTFSDYPRASLRDALGKTLVELGETDPEVLVLNADLRSSVKTTYFMERFPERTVELGIAEQNMMGVAAGLAMQGYKPFTVTFARFASKRAADQISMCIDYCRNNVRIIGAYAGIFTGMQGVSQQMIDDTAAMRAMPNMTVVDTADAVEIAAVLRYSLTHEGPIYIRVGRDDWPVVFDPATYRFELGKGQWLRHGTDVAILNSGVLLPYVLEAADILARAGHSVAVANMPSVKPLDIDLVRLAAARTGALVAVENHSIEGGFGGAVAEALVAHHPCVLERVGIAGGYSQSAPNEDLAEHHGLTALHIAEAAHRAMKRAQSRLAGPEAGDSSPR